MDIYRYETRENPVPAMLIIDSKNIQNADTAEEKGYIGDSFANAIFDLKGAAVEAAKRSELHKFAVIPKRWIVERSFGWIDKCRILWKNCERFIENTLSLAKLAFLSVLLKRF